MPSVVIPNTMSMAVDWNANGVPRMTNVFHFFIAGGMAVNQALADLAAAQVALAFVSSNWEDEVATSIGLERVRIRDLRTANQAELIGIINDDGLNAGTLMPLQNAVVVTLRTALAGRSFRGRVYLGGLTEAANGADGAVASTTRTRAADFVESIRDRMQAETTAQMSVASRTIPTNTVVTTIEVRDGRWDTQRGRGTPTA